MATFLLPGSVEAKQQVPVTHRTLPGHESQLQADADTASITTQLEIQCLVLALAVRPGDPCTATPGCCALTGHSFYASASHHCHGDQNTLLATGDLKTPMPAITDAAAERGRCFLQGSHSDATASCGAGTNNPRGLFPPTGGSCFQKLTHLLSTLLRRAVS